MARPLRVLEKRREGVKSLVDKYVLLGKKGAMARPLRILYQGAVYHVMNRVLARQPVVHTAADPKACPEVLQQHLGV